MEDFDEIDDIQTFGSLLIDEPLFLEQDSGDEFSWFPPALPFEFCDNTATSTEQPENKTETSFDIVDGKHTHRYYLAAALQPALAPPSLKCITGNKWVQLFPGTSTLVTAEVFRKHVRRNMRACAGGYVHRFDHIGYSASILLNEGRWDLLVWVPEKHLDKFRPMFFEHVDFLAWDANTYVCRYSLGENNVHPCEKCGPYVTTTMTVKDLSFCINVLKKYIQMSHSNNYGKSDVSPG